MGLDITAYGSVRRIGDTAEEPGYRTVNLYVDRPERAGELTTGLYDYGGSELRFRAGSYSGYNAWRAWLSETVLGVQPEAVWAEPSRYAGRPFVELIDFSDCDGTIGPEVSDKLARDFRKHRAKVERSLTESDESQWNMQKYDEWAAAFALAARMGAVQFH